VVGCTAAERRAPRLDGHQRRSQGRPQCVERRASAPQIHPDSDHDRLRWRRFRPQRARKSEISHAQNYRCRLGGGFPPRWHSRRNCQPCRQSQPAPVLAIAGLSETLTIVKAGHEQSVRRHQAQAGQDARA
jgi:hypothetical protein